MKRTLQVFPLPNWNRSVAILLTTIMVASSIAMVAPHASAQDVVPTKPTIPFQVIPEMRQFFYARFDDLAGGGQPDCTTAGSSKLQLTPASDPNGGLTGRQPCQFAANAPAAPVPGGAQTLASSVDFTIAPNLTPLHRVALTGNSSLFLHYTGSHNGIALNVNVLSANSTIATGVLADGGPADVPLTIAGVNANTGRVYLEQSAPVVLRIAAVAAPAGAGGAPAQPMRWTVDDRATSIEVRADDAIRAASWITDEKDAIKTLFAPISNDSQLPADKDHRFVGHFALASAFGTDDAAGAAPKFSVLRPDGRPMEIATGGNTVLTGDYNSSASVTNQGVNVWSFPLGSVPLKGFPAGTYTLHVEKSHRQGAPINRGTDVVFSIATQSVRLDPFADDLDPTIVESQAHTVQPGSSTTYVLQVNNSGTVNDTYTVNVTAANAPPGWGSRLGGPDVLGGRISVPHGERRVFTLTVNAPFNGSGEVIHLVNVTSTLDPGVRSRDLTLVTTIRQDLDRTVGVIFLSTNTTITPGVESSFPTYVWNRGTRVANVSLEVQETPISGWKVGIAFGGAAVSRVVLSSIQPGDISLATLKVTGPANALVASHPVTLNVTHQDVQGVSAARRVTFTLATQAGVTMTVLDTLSGGARHVAELDASNQLRDFPGGTPPEQTLPNCAPNPACSPNGFDGIWFRTWITNTGQATDTFDLSADSFVSNCIDPATAKGPYSPPVLPTGPLGGTFGFYTRNPSGDPIGETNVVGDLPQGKTAELYLWVPIKRANTPCTTIDQSSVENLTFVIQARGRNSGAIARHVMFVAAQDAITEDGSGNGGEGSRAIYLEAVSREPGYSGGTPYVDLANVSSRSVIGTAEPGGNATYYVRMTNAANWADYTDSAGNHHEADLKVELLNVKYEQGWNVSIRPVLDSGVNDILRNPYGATYNLSNTNGAVNPPRNEGWFDRELEVVVQAPSVANASAVANLQHEFTILASTNATNAKSSLSIVTIVAPLANVTARSDQPRVFAHPGEAGAALVYITNNGSIAADVTLRASMNNQTTNNAPAWQVDPNAQRFPLAAFKNRTIALLVTPPAGATQGTTGELNVSLEYARDPTNFPNATTNVTLRLPIEIVAQGTLQLTSPITTATIAPSGIANFTMTLKNTGSVPTQFKLNATPIPNWTVDVSPDQGTLSSGDTRLVTLVMRAPGDVTNDTRFASVVSVQEVGAANNFDTSAFTVNILGGKALPKLFAPILVKRVDRSGTNAFQVQVQNIGTAAGRIPLEVRSSDPAWSVGLVDARGANITSVQLAPNELANINVTVTAPFNVPEHTVTPVEITGFSPDLTQSSKATLSAEVHDYGVQLTIVNPSKDVLPGLPQDYTIRLKNTGNDNDTLNLSANLVDQPEWSVQLSSEEVRLEPNQEQELHATIRSPTGPLPAARTYTIPFWVGTRGGQAVNITKNMTQSAVVTIPNYRAYDVDKDGQLEITVDLNKRASDGFEEFREIFTEGLQTQVVAKGLFEGRTTFFLDVPKDKPYDGVADIWFNPESVYAYDIPHAPDINGDGNPDYLLDTDRDGKVDKAFDSATEQFLSVVEIHVYGDTRTQYLVDTTGDGHADRFYDPETGKVTRTTRADSVGKDYVGIDVNDDNHVDYYYNPATQTTSHAQTSNLTSFAQTYWYFFVVFALLVILTVVLLVRRSRKP